MKKEIQENHLSFRRKILRLPTVFKSFNIPEFSTIAINLNPGDIRKLAKTDATPAKWHKN